MAPHRRRGIDQERRDGTRDLPADGAVRHPRVQHAAAPAISPLQRRLEPDPQAVGAELVSAVQLRPALADALRVAHADGVVADRAFLRRGFRWRG